MVLAQGVIAVLGWPQPLWDPLPLPEAQASHGLGSPHVHDAVERKG